MIRKILCLTGTRSDYSCMRPVYSLISKVDYLSLFLVITGMHFLENFKNSLIEIYKDNFGMLIKTPISSEIDTLSNMPIFIGKAIIEISKIIEKVKPDIILLQGDRGEMLACAIAGAHMNIPIVHMSGGDFTGSIDDSIRNSITKFSHIHLTTCAGSTKRLLSMGENKNRIFEVGEPILDLINELDYISAIDLMKEFNLDLTKPIILATQHPVTNEYKDSLSQIKETLEALREINIQTIFTYPNTDLGWQNIVKLLEKYKNEEFIRIVPNLGYQKYLSIMKISSLILGNSSSGIIEAPSFKIPVINIGTRQYNRIRSNNVIDVGYNKDEIKKSIFYALNDEKFRTSLVSCKNPYGDGSASKKTVEILLKLKINSFLISKWLDKENRIFTEN